jgi:hypothetical protein
MYRYIALFRVKYTLLKVDIFLVFQGAATKRSPELDQAANRPGIETTTARSRGRHSTTASLTQSARVACAFPPDPRLNLIHHEKKIFSIFLCAHHLQPKLFL